MDARRTSELGQLLDIRSVQAPVPDWARTIGVTRVARVTGLDRCGVEVACAIRPDGQVLQVSNGKGATFAHAQASALSEALELWACENPDSSHLTWRSEESDGSFWPSELLSESTVADRNRGAVRPWVEAERLDRTGRVFIPASQVWCPSAGGVSVGLRDSPWTANGLGAHPTRSRARWHGLFEVLEREAISQIFPEGWTPRHLGSLGLRFDHPRVIALEVLGLRVHCVDATPEGWLVPVVAVLIADRDSRAPQLAAGYACRRTPEEAAEAALFEACQSRLTEIHGAREDVVQSRAGVPDWVWRRRSHRRTLNDLPRWTGGMRSLLKSMNLVAAAVDVSSPKVPLAVERVFVPGFRISDLLL